MQKIAYTIFYLTIFLIAVGVVMIYGASAILASERYHDAFFFLKKELMWFSIGMVALYVGYRVPYRFWIAASPWVLMTAVALLVFVLVGPAGYEVGGARRWLKFGAFGFQPSEVAKYAVIFFLAYWLEKHQESVRSFGRGFLVPMMMVGTVCGLILLEPDLGTTVGIGSVCLMMLFVGGVRIRYLLCLGLMSLPALYYLVAGAAYRRARILAFLDPWKDPKGVGFQIIQSFIALGSGGLTGAGLGESRQKLFYLPEAHTDFIFSIIGEELGFIGVLVVCSAFIALFTLCYRVVLKTRDLGAHLLGFGITSLLALQTFVNIGVVTGTLPTKGLPLPFISFGGSSLVLSMAGIGILMNLALSLRFSKGEPLWQRRPRVSRSHRAGRVYISSRRK